MESAKLKNILEAVLAAADRPLTVPQLEQLFTLDEDPPTRDEIRKALHDMEQEFAERSMEIKQVANGYRMQVKQDYAQWVGRLWEEKPARYSRALLETLALIAYRQPITRGEIEEVRGVSVSSNIIKTLLEREWIRVLGHKDVPGKPSLYGTTKEFLDYFNLKSLDQLPTLAEIKDLDQIHPELALEEDAEGEQAAAPETADAQADADTDVSENTQQIEAADDTAQQDAAENVSAETQTAAEDSIDDSQEQELEADTVTPTPSVSIH